MREPEKLMSSAEQSRNDQAILAPRKIKKGRKRLKKVGILELKFGRSRKLPQYPILS